jgi:N-acetylmuramate 1-kinase
MEGTESGLPAKIVRTAADLLGAAPETLCVSKLTGDASTRSYYRLAQQDAARGVVVAAYAAPFDEAESAAARLNRAETTNPAARLTFANDPCAHVEVTRLFLKAGLPVPRILAALGREGALIFEDVGDIRLQDWLPERDLEDKRRAYFHAAELIIAIQETTGVALSSGSISARLAFDQAKLKWELGFFFANYFNKHLCKRLDPATSQGVQRDFTEICSELAARPRVLVHRDYHARNLMMHGERMVMIDHQDARMGPESYDLASLVGDPYTALDADFRAEVVEHFIELKTRSAVQFSDIRAFRKELILMTLQRTLKAIGTYANQVAVARNLVYLPYIEPALNSAVAAMKELGRFDSTRKLLEESRI